MKKGSAPAKSDSAKSQQGRVRPLAVQLIAKQMQKLIAQRQLLTSRDESDALTPGTGQAKKAASGK